jgi:hypothetical protein
MQIIIFNGKSYLQFHELHFLGEGGSIDDEVVVSKQGNTVFSVNFTNCLWRVKAAPTNITSSGIIANVDPQFDSIDIQKREFNFRLKPSSPGINKGVATSLTIDLDGKPRAVGIPDLGRMKSNNFANSCLFWKLSLLNLRNI